MFALEVPDGLSHNELQALVAALAEVPLARKSPAGYIVTVIREAFLREPGGKDLSSILPEMH